MLSRSGRVETELLLSRTNTLTPRMIQIQSRDSSSSHRAAAFHLVTAEPKMV